MGKLNIAHHKSYHPYRRDNIERVRRDEEEAQIKEAQEEGRMLLADSEARLALLRERADMGTSAKSRRKDEEACERELLKQATDPSRLREVPAAAGPSSLTAIGGGKHINLFEELEQSTVQVALAKTRELDKLARKKGKEGDDMEKGVPLAPSAKDLKPWYSERAKESDGDLDEGRRTRDLSHKSRSDPLTAIQRELATQYPSAASQTPSYMNGSRRRDWRNPSSISRSGPEPGGTPGGNKSHNSGADASVERIQVREQARAARETRESSERKRALELIARKKREKMAGSETPSTVLGTAYEDEDAFHYGNQFNSQAVAEAHRRRDMVDVRMRSLGSKDCARTRI